MYPGLADWWARAEEAWNIGKSKGSDLTLLGRLDYQKTLTSQLPLVPGAYRVVYNKSGMYLAAAIVSGDAVVNNSLYWGSVSSLEEARYIEAILNSALLTVRLRPLQSRGEHNPRHYDMYVWQIPIPLFDPRDETHIRLTQLAADAERIAAALVLDTGKRFESQRRVIRDCGVRNGPYHRGTSGGAASHLIVLDRVRLPIS